MKLHPNYKKALEKRYSHYSLDEFVKKAENSHLYSQHKNYYNAFIFHGEPKEKIVKDEYDENYIGYKYEGKIKEKFEIIKYCYYFDGAIDKSPEGEKIILDTFSSINKYPDKDYNELFINKVYEDQDNESNFFKLEEAFMDLWEYSISKADGMENIFGQELICEGDFNIIDQYESNDYLQEPGPFKILNINTGDYEDVYLEYQYPSFINYILFKTKGFERLDDHSKDIYENIKAINK